MSDIKPLLRSAKEKLAAAEISEVDAEHLLAYVLGISRMDLHNSVKLEDSNNEWLYRASPTAGNRKTYTL